MSYTDQKPTGIVSPSAPFPDCGPTGVGNAPSDMEAGAKNSDLPSTKHLASPTNSEGSHGSQHNWTGPNNTDPDLLSQPPAKGKLRTEGEPSFSAGDEDAPVTQMFKQLETCPILQRQLIAEIKGIYAGLVMAETKCIEVDSALNAQGESAAELSNEQWQALIALHRTLLQECYDFFLALQHPSANHNFHQLASKYAMPARMWRHGVHSFLEVLRHRLPMSLEHMKTFINLAYSLMALFYETVPAFNVTYCF